MSRSLLIIIGLIGLGPSVFAHEHPPVQAADFIHTIVATPAFDSGGRLWLAWVAGGHVYVNHSDDLGGRFSVPVRVNAEAMQIHNNGEARPKVVVDGEGRIFVAYTETLAKPFTGQIRFSRSLDGGESFSSPVIVNDNREVISHRFVSMLLDGKGNLHLLWLDARDFNSAGQRGEAYQGSALYHAVSDDHGGSFSRNSRLSDHTCQCCRIALALDRRQSPVAFWRHIFSERDNTISRDHALLNLDSGEVRRVSRERWQQALCPHHGPALAIDDGNRYHMAWFNVAAGSPGLYYSRSADEGLTTTPAWRFSDDDPQAGHPALLALGQDIYLAWRSYDGNKSSILLRHSVDGGMHWDERRVIAETAEEADYPVLLQHEGRVYLSWKSRGAYQLKPIGGYEYR